MISEVNGGWADPLADFHDWLIECEERVNIRPPGKHNERIIHYQAIYPSAEEWNWSEAEECQRVIPDV